MRRYVRAGVALCCAGVLLTGCDGGGFLNRTVDPRINAAAVVADQVARDRVPYAPAGGSVEGATGGVGGTRPGFDEAGLLRYAFGKNKLLVGASVSEIYDETTPVDDDEGEEGDGLPKVVPGDLLFTEDRSSVAIVVDEGRDSTLDDALIVFADKDSGRVVSETWTESSRFVPEPRAVDPARASDEFRLWKRNHDIGDPGAVGDHVAPGADGGQAGVR